MKTITHATLLAAVLGFALPASAASTMDSIYTSLDTKDCKTLESHEDEGGWYKGRCAGVAGYKLDVSEGDLRQSVTIIAPGGKDFPLDLWHNVSGGFSALGQKAEWRVRKDGSKTTPIALIVRFNASEDPAYPEKTTSYLVVSKISATESCITDVVKPIPNANVKARELADIASSKACKTPPQ